MTKNYAVRLRCPYGDEDRWVTLENREETPEQILSTSWDFECSLHGVQREFPMEAKEQDLAVSPKPQSEPAEPVKAKPRQRASKRLSLHVPVSVFGWARDRSAFHEDTSTVVVNAGGGLVPLTTKVEPGETVVVVNKSTQEEQECHVAFVGPELRGQTQVGMGFKQPAPSFWRSNRQEYRVAKTLRVRIRGTDRNGNRFSQTAYTIDISRRGARLDGTGYLTEPGATIEVRRLWRKARFRVVWTGQIGTPQANQMGICSLEPDKNIWGVRLPEPGPDKA